MIVDDLVAGIDMYICLGNSSEDNRLSRDNRKLVKFKIDLEIIEKLSILFTDCRYLIVLGLLSVNIIIENTLHKEFREK